ncbi:hypothetical protein CJ030_MR3G019160 [Morella rubra]|uniref:Uncharacterized protein n=1 Tax=Morella rubra TaxID=262757 RepID=A0A6A1W6H9_9ROSI|nr:hypothetical protein CJ030_MR3G019160 [Morella rubra]
MANQPTQIRPWGRLSSIARPVAPPPAPTPEPRPPVVRPMFRPLVPSQRTQPQQSTAPTSTVVGSTTTVNAPLPVPVVATTEPLPVTNSVSIRSSPTPRGSNASSGVPTSASPQAAPVPVALSPIAKAELAPTSLATKTAKITTGPSATAASMRLPSPILPPKTIQPDIQTSAKSPNSKSTAQPPSPLKLPPSHVKSDPEPERKVVVVQKTIEKPKSWLGGNGDSQKEFGESYKPSLVHNGKQEVSKQLETKEMEKHNLKKITDSEVVGVRVITIAGENKGAFMELIQSPKKHVVGDTPYLNKNGNPKMRSHGSEYESYSTSSDKEGKSKKDKSHKGKVMSSLPMSAFMNSNVQSINNSILYNCSCTHHDPGVHLALSRKPAGEFQVKEHLNGNQN